MSNQWFRMYSEFAHDPKVQSMSEAMQRRLMMLLCLKCDGSVTSLEHDELCHALHITSQELSETKELFLKKGFVSDNWDILNWDKRQYKSDKSSERTKAWRDRKQVVTKCDVTVTPPDTDTDTDTEVELVNKRKRVRVPLDDLDISHNAIWLAEQRRQGNYINHDEKFILEKFKNYCKSKGKTYADYLAGYRNAFDWEQCQPRKEPRGNHSIQKPTFASEAERIAANFLAQPERQGSVDDSARTSMRIAEAVR